MKFWQVTKKNETKKVFAEKLKKYLQKMKANVFSANQKYAIDMLLSKML